MAASSYDAALARLLVHEGGYTNHPADPGRTDQFRHHVVDYRKYVEPDATAADVKGDAARRSQGDLPRQILGRAALRTKLPAGVDYAVFDYGVNSGIGRSGKVLRRVLNLPDTTSVVTDAVIDAARAGDAKALIAAICDERLRFLQSLKTWSVFGAGRGRRVARCGRWRSPWRAERRRPT